MIIGSNCSLQDIYKDLQDGRLSLLWANLLQVNQYILYLLQKQNLTEDEVKDLELLIKIGNITYNNMDTNPPIEDGIYDLMIECYRRYNNNVYPVGAEPVQFKPEHATSENTVRKRLFEKITDEELEYEKQMMFPEILQYSHNHFNIITQTTENSTISKRLHNTSHNHPDLVGTFDKCKFVLNSQAADAGVLNDSNVRVVERDFFQPLLEAGVIGANEKLTVIATLKYDGISVEADCSSILHSARTRGDTGVGKASDITPILAGYRFPNSLSQANGIKFEAIISEYNLAKLNDRKNYQYANCRMAIIGVMNSSEATNYRDLITLVPISTDIKDGQGNPLDRLVELDFLNRYYATDEIMRYSVFTGNYASLLYQMKRFVEEAEFARTRLPFMYDGVVFEFYDPKVRTLLGRDNFIDRYKVAVKFNPINKQTIFRGYTYTVGQDGSITPMIHYDPIEFMGTIHDKSSGHSYKRFKELDLHYGDIIDVKYVNDVMPYVYKPVNAHNKRNSKNAKSPGVDLFPTHCPFCGGEIGVSSTGDSAYCLNMHCPEIAVKRMTNMLAKLGIVNFSENTIRALPYRTFRSLMIASEDPNNFAVLGPNEKLDFSNQLQNIKKVPQKDYKIIGSLGFTSIAEKTWKLILSKISLSKFLEYYKSGGYTQDNLRSTLINIKGIGETTIEVILNEMELFVDDIIYILNNIPLTDSVRNSLIKAPQIRFTHCRDAELEKYLDSLGYDADSSAGVTKETTVLLVPYPEFTQGNKYKKAAVYGIPIVSIEEFKENMNQYL